MNHDKKCNLRADYLRLIGTVVKACYARRSLTQWTLGPFTLQGDAPHPNDAIKRGEILSEIRKTCRAMRNFEKKHGFGIGVVLGDVPDSVRGATSLLVAGAMTARVPISTVGELAQLAISGDDPVELLEVLISFEGRGRLREHITMDEKGAANTGQCRNPALKESSVRAILGMTEADEVPSSLIETEEQA